MPYSIANGEKRLLFLLFFRGTTHGICKRFGLYSRSLSLRDYPKLRKSIGTDWTKKFPFTQKTGIMYENWGQIKDEFFHPFPLGLYSIHCSPKDFQDFVCNNLKFNFKETSEHIINYDDIDASYIIDCRGTPKTFESYDSMTNPLNAALLANLPKKENDVKYEKTYCHFAPITKPFKT